MKSRTCFVSNSSSCSFVLIGCKATLEELKKALNITFEDEDDYYDELHDIIEESEFDYFPEEEVFGICISKADCDEELDKIDISFDKAEEFRNKVAEKLGVHKGNIRILTGTRSC